MASFTLEELQSAWEAIINRDRSWDSRIYFGVKSTGIYCRPSCPSKRPRREVVEYFLTSREAEDHGYRACKRCKPQENPIDLHTFMLIMKTLEDQSNDIQSVREWAEAAGLTVSKLRKSLKENAGILPGDYLMGRKFNLFKRNVQTGGHVIESQFDAGFGSTSRLYEQASKNIGMTPGIYRKRGIGMQIHYRVLVTPLGKLLIAGTLRGVCSVKFGESDSDLISDLKHEFQGADIKPDQGELSAWAEQIDQYFSGMHRNLDIPLDLKATAFQMKVWNELRKIPFGETRSYSELAEAVGKPSAARAAASACAANPVALVNPCHRIVHRDRSLSGYRWGIERKKALLELERKNSS